MTEPTQMLAAGRFLHLLRRGSWEYATRPEITGVVAIVAVTEAGELVLVEQWRPPIQRQSLELPAGVAGDLPGSDSETLEDAARRELLEETGYRAQHMERVAEGTTSPGLTDEVLTVFVATGLERTGPGGGDETESITVHHVPLAAAERWIESWCGGGGLVDLKVHAGVQLARRA